MRVGKSHLGFREGMQKRRERESVREGGETRRAVTLPRTPDSAFYFPPHVLFRAHFVLFGSSLWGLIAQLMSGDGTCRQTSASELVTSLVIWSEAGEKLVRCLDNRVLEEVQSSLLHIKGELSQILICLLCSVFKSVKL